MYHTAGAIGTGGVLGLRQTGRKLITDLRAILKSFFPLWLERFSVQLLSESKFK